MKAIKFFAVGITAVTLMSCNGKGMGNASLETQIDSVSYAVGMDMGIKSRKNFDEVNRDAFIAGYLHGVDSAGMKFEQKELSKIMSDYFRKKRFEEQKVKAEAAMKKAEKEFGHFKIEGEKFLAENKNKKGVITTDSGLQYIVMKEGKGNKPKRSDRVKVHYHGTLIDGTVFDSSVEKGKPYETGVGQVIQGWIEGLQLMNEGAKYKFFVPQELAYGHNPRPGVIKPFMPLIFEVELLEIKKK